MRAIVVDVRVLKPVQFVEISSVYHSGIGSEQFAIAPAPWNGQKKAQESSGGSEGRAVGGERAPPATEQD
ncbi:unnamed protein product [Parnassius mnemosyne]|uniref:Uncharacterized protein n=1 Tax=Parnassius mnemosyne TaxID=213953 RepID=A0AAV1KC61_9NEOP